MDFYSTAGKVALGSRLRRLGEQFMDDAARVYELYDVALDPKWFPVFYVLSEQSTASITEIAQAIGHSHPSVSQLVKEMKTRGLVVMQKSKQDARVSVVQLSDLGKQLIPKLQTQCADVTQAVDGLLSEAQHDVWNAIAEVEYLLSEQSFYDRVRSVRKARERQAIAIVDYSPEFRDVFKRLNVEWIEHYFELEDTDLQCLNAPEETILAPGGHIYMALSDGVVVGTCALIKVDDATYELAKMAVTETARGRGIGWLLGQAAIQKARALGAQTLYLESNTVLEPAISLYQKLGFRKVVGHPSPYERCNIQMALELAE